MKKIILILLAVLLAATTMLIPVYATDPSGITAGETAGPAGGTVDVYVSLYGLTEVTSIAVEYNIPEGLTYKSAEWILEGDIVTVDTAKKAALWGVSSQKAKNMTDSTKILKITYNVAENASGVIYVDLKATVKIESQTDKLVYNTMAQVNVLIPATGVTLSGSTLELDMSGTTEGSLTAQVLPGNTTDKLSWTSSNPNVVTVDRNGNVTAVAQGTAQITATAGNVSAVCNVTVICSHTGAIEYKANEATCDAEGNHLYYKCDSCQQYLKADKATATTPNAEKINKLGHDATHHPKVASTCSVNGTAEYWSCGRCGKNYANSECTRVLMSMELPLDSGNHTGNVEWTKTEANHSAAYKCCGAVTVAEEQHEWSNGKCAECQYECAHSGGTATCTTKAVCGKCQASYGDLKTSNHTGTAQWTTDKTHHAKAYSCCGAAVVAKEVHEWSNGKCAECQYVCVHSGGVATCNAKAVCENCKISYGELNANNHVGGTKVVNVQAATCYKGGYSGDTKCLGCDKVTIPGTNTPATELHVAGEQWFKDNTHHWHKCTTDGCVAIVGKAEHNFQWKSDKDATEYETGLKHEECVCGEKRNEGTVIPKLDHVHKGITHHKAVAATCTSAGTVEYWTCSSDLCSGKYYGDAKCQLALDTIVEKINPANHTGGTQIKDAAEANCYKSGYTGDTYCKGCGVKTAVGSVINATGKHVAAGPWLTDETHHYHACATAGCTATVDKAAHSFQWKVDKEATEEQAGLKHEECACGYKRSENTQIEKLEHKPTLVAGKENTCTEDGVKEHFYCANCDRYFASDAGKVGAQIQVADTVLKATGHSYGEEWVTDTKDHWHVCHCGDVSDKAAHTAKLEGAVEATKNEAGYTGDSICSVCGYEISKGEVIPSKSEEVLDDVQNAQNGSSIQIVVPNDDGTRDAIVSAEVLEAAKGKDVELVLDMGDYQWTIQGSSITGADLENIDLKVELDTQKIPQETVSKLAGNAATMQLSLVHEGEFGFKANLKINVGVEHAGKNGKLYYYNDKKELEPVGGDVIGEDGSIVLEFGHASDYVLVIEEKAAENSGAIWWIVLAVVVVGAAAVAAVLITKKKRK